MNKIATIAAITALTTLSACYTENVEVPADEAASANVELNDDGSVKSTEPTTEATTEAGK